MNWMLPAWLHWLLPLYMAAKGTTFSNDTHHAYV